jgi:hypothetical protein
MCAEKPPLKIPGPYPELTFLNNPHFPFSVNAFPGCYFYFLFAEALLHLKRI